MTDPGLTADDVRRILELIDDSHYGELRLEIGDLRLYVRKEGEAATLAPLETRTFTVSRFPQPAAQCKGVSPVVPGKSTAAPHFNRNWTTEAWPFAAAPCSGDSPAESMKLTFAPLSTSERTKAKSPTQAAP